MEPDWQECWLVWDPSRDSYQWTGGDRMPADVLPAMLNTAVCPMDVNRIRWTDEGDHLWLEWSRDGGETWERTGEEEVDDDE